MTREFWNKEYKDPIHLTLSTEPSSDLLDFVKWAQRNAEWPAFPKHGLVVDIGCGNGRNLIPLCHEFNMNGLGTDVSEVALEQARAYAKRLKTGEGLTPEQLQGKRNPGLHIDFQNIGAEQSLPLEDQSVDVVLDMMVSHQLTRSQRLAFVAELARVLKPYGWLYFKTFILDGDVNAKRMLVEHPITKDLIQKNSDLADEQGRPEENSYIHPHTKGIEHIFTDEEIGELFSQYFKIYKTKKSYRHVRDGKPFKRRTISVYMERLRD